MLTVLAVIGVIVVLFVAGVVATRGTDGMVELEPDRADLDLPDGPVQPEDIATLRFSVALRGYRMSEVDEVLERLGRDLAERDARIAELTGQPTAGPPDEPDTAFAMSDPEPLLGWDEAEPGHVAPAPAEPATQAAASTSAPADAGSWRMPEVTPATAEHAPRPHVPDAPEPLSVPDAPAEEPGAEPPPSTPEPQPSTPEPQPWTPGPALDPEPAAQQTQALSAPDGDAPELGWPETTDTSSTAYAESGVTVTPVEDAPPPGPPVEDVVPPVEVAPEPPVADREQSPRQ